MSTTSMAIFSNPLFATYSVYARNASIINNSTVVVFALGLHVIVDIEPIIPAGIVVVTVTVGVRPVCLCQICSAYFYSLKSYKGGPKISKFDHVTYATHT